MSTEERCSQCGELLKASYSDYVIDADGSVSASPHVCHEDYNTAVTKGPYQGSSLPAFRKCPHCGKSFKGRKLKPHLDVCPELRFVSVQPRGRVKSRGRGNRSTKTTTWKEVAKPPQVVCPFCKATMSKGSLDHHIQVRCPKRLASHSQPQQSQQQSRVASRPVDKLTKSPAANISVGSRDATYAIKSSPNIDGSIIECHHCGILVAPSAWQAHLLRVHSGTQMVQHFEASPDSEAPPEIPPASLGRRPSTNVTRRQQSSIAAGPKAQPRFTQCKSCGIFFQTKRLDHHSRVCSELRVSRLDTATEGVERDAEDMGSSLQSIPSSLSGKQDRAAEYKRANDDLGYADKADASKYWGHFARDNGQFGSYPVHDDHSDESEP